MEPRVWDIMSMKPKHAEASGLDEARHTFPSMLTDPRALHCQVRWQGRLPRSCHALGLTRFIVSLQYSS